MHGEINFHARRILRIDLNFLDAAYGWAARITDFRAGLQSSGVLEIGVKGAVTGGQRAGEKNQRGDEQPTCHQHK